MAKDQIYQLGMTFLILYAPNDVASAYIKQKLTEVQGKFTTIVDFNIALVFCQAENN